MGNPYAVPDEGYTKFLEGELDYLEELVTRLVLDCMRRTPVGEPLDPVVMEFKHWLGDDWYIDLPEDERKIVGAHEGWYEPGWEI